MERGGKVDAMAVRRVVTGRELEFLLSRLDTEGSTLKTDENNVHGNIERFIDHKSVNHSERCVDGTPSPHTNTLEGFWSLLTRAWFGKHRQYKVKFMPLYAAEARWKYNHRRTMNIFNVFIRGCFA